MVKVEFTKGYATKKKGDSMEVDSMLARTLVDQKVAKIVKEKAKEKKS
jgi:hypothetical protein